MRGAAALNVVIAGGGPAGCAAAIGLARNGVRTTVLERSRKAQDVVCGGFLGWDALARLEALGLDVARLGARPIARLRLVAGRRSVEAALPHSAAGLSRRTLDEALRALAAEAGAEVRRGVTVRAWEDGALRLADGATLRLDALVLATGKHELRGLARPRDPAAAIGLRTALPATPALAAALDGVIELHLFDGGYAGLLLQEDGTANLCLSVAPSRVHNPVRPERRRGTLSDSATQDASMLRHRSPEPSLGTNGLAGGVDKLFNALATDCPLLAERAAGADPAAWSAIAGVPYGWCARDTAPGVFRVGDQAAVIASLAGDGVAIALASGMMAADILYRAGPDIARPCQRGFAHKAERPLAAASAARWIAEHRFPRAAALGLIGAAPSLAGLIARATRIG